MGLGWPWWRAWVPVGAVVTRLFAWQAWHLVTSTFTLGGKRGTGLALAARLGPGWRVSQAWHLATSTFTLRGRRATWRHLLAPHMAGVALVALGCLWWRAWVRLVLLSPRLLVWQAGIDLHLCVAGVAVTGLGWLWWRAWVPVGAVVAARHLVTSTFASHGRGCTW